MPCGIGFKNVGSNENNLDIRKNETGDIEIKIYSRHGSQSLRLRPETFCDFIDCLVLARDRIGINSNIKD